MFFKGLLRSLRAKLMVFTALFLVLTQGLLAYYFLNAEKERITAILVNQTSHQFAIIGATIQSELKQKGLSAQAIPLKPLLGKNSNVSQITVSNKYGQAIAGYPHSIGTLDTHADERLINAAFDSKKRLTSFYEKEMKLSEALVDSNEQIIGGLSITFDKSELNAYMSQAAREHMIVVGLVGIIGLVGAWLVASQFTIPIIRLAQIAEKFGQGKFDHRPNKQTSDEIGTLANSLNRMADNIIASTVSVDFLNSVFDSIDELIF